MEKEELSLSESSNLVSIIVPVYNVEKFLGRCLDSILCQTVSCFEVICVDDGSTDGSLEILREYERRDSRIKVVTKLNGGLSSARNVGLEKASGTFVMFVDSDDWIEDSTVEKALSFMKGDVDVVIWYARLIPDGVDPDCDNMRLGSAYHSIKEAGEERLDASIIKSITCTVWNKLFKRSILETYGIRFVEGRLFEDNDFTFCYLVHCSSCFFIDEYLYNYVQRPDSIMGKVRRRECLRTEDNLYIFESLYRHLEQYGLLEEYSQLVSWRFSIHLKSAYLNAPDEKKSDIRDLAVKFAAGYDPDIFSQNIIENLRNRKFHLIRELSDIVVTLTSYPARINTVHCVVESLLNQSLYVDKIVLWLAQSQFPGGEQDLPQPLLNLLESNHFEICWCEDIRSFKKIIPSLKKYPNSFLITADDDLLYDRNFVKNLWEAHLRNPDVIVCHRAYRIGVENGEVLPYKLWQLDVHSEPSYSIFPTSGAGVLYMPHCFDDTVYEEKLFMELTPDADDIWLWAMLVKNGQRCMLIKNNLPDLNVIKETQQEALYYKNVLENGNDRQLKAVFEKFPVVQRRVLLDDKRIVMMDDSEKILAKKEKLKRTVVVDFKNYGSEENDLEVIECSAESKINSAIWMNDKNGIGYRYVGADRKLDVLFKCVKDGNLKIKLSGMEIRNNRKQLVNLQVGFMSLVVNGTEMLNDVKFLSFEEWALYDLPVSDGQEVQVSLVWSDHLDAVKKQLNKRNAELKRIKNSRAFKMSSFLSKIYWKLRGK